MLPGGEQASLRTVGRSSGGLKGRCHSLGIRADQSAFNSKNSSFAESRNVTRLAFVLRRTEAPEVRLCLTVRWSKRCCVSELLANGAIPLREISLAPFQFGRPIRGFIPLPEQGCRTNAVSSIVLRKFSGMAPTKNEAVNPEREASPRREEVACQDKMRL
jgi:hypothetical protein